MCIGQLKRLFWWLSGQAIVIDEPYYQHGNVKIGDVFASSLAYVHKATHLFDQFMPYINMGIAPSLICVVV